MGWAIVVWSTFLIDHWELFGLRQVWCRFTGRALPRQGFRTPALYRFSRHPMMVGMMIGLWATPDLSVDRFCLAMGFTLYILFGTRVEERDLVNELGAPYRRYQRQVARFVPLPGLRTRRAAKVVLCAWMALGLASEGARASDLSSDVSLARRRLHLLR